MIKVYFAFNLLILCAYKMYSKQEMFINIVSCFGYTWFLLCLEILHAHWLSSCMSENPAF